MRINMKPFLNKNKFWRVLKKKKTKKLKKMKTHQDYLKLVTQNKNKTRVTMIMEVYLELKYQQERESTRDLEALETKQIEKGNQCWLMIKLMKPK